MLHSRSLLVVTLILLWACNRPRRHAATALQPRACSFDLASLGVKAGDIVLVDFWASWCEPCRASLPIYDAWQVELGALGFRTIGVSIDDDRRKAERFHAQYGPRTTLLFDEKQRIAEQAALPGMPTAFLIDRAGVCVDVVSGFSDETTARLRTRINALLDAH